MGIGGKERQLLYLLQSLSEICSIQLFVFSENISFFSEVNDLPLQLITFKKSQRKSINTFISVYRALNGFNPDIIHAWDNLPHCIALPYMMVKRPKVVNGSIRYGGMIKKSLAFSLMQKTAFITSQKIVSNSKAGLSAERLLANKKAEFVHSGLNLSQIKRQSDIPLEIRNIQKRFAFSVAMVARFSPLKDYITFVRAAKLLEKNNPDVAFFCIGDGPDRQRAEAEAGPLLHQNIFFLGGSRKDIRNIMHAFDIGVLLNNTKGHGEGISNAIMEYMAAGLPVIATDAGGTPELVKDKISGFLVPAFDPEIVVEKINYLLKNEQIRKEMGQKGKKIIEAEFNLGKMVSSYLNLYQNLLGRL